MSGWMAPDIAEPDQRELPFVGLLLPGGEIDVGQRIELRDRDVDVADADARREHRHAFAFVGAGHRFELTVCDFALFRIEMFRYQGPRGGSPTRITVSANCSGTQVQMEKWNRRR